MNGISISISHTQGYPYTKDKVIQQARIDICPFFRAEVWAVLLGVKVIEFQVHMCLYVYVHVCACVTVSHKHTHCVFLCVCVRMLLE